ncbi:putative origin recognition complex subunit 2 [Cladophialophora carrionii]|uniref:Origin recognition complex subunit 2 n=1 Tax=Cladophialophora carrionii TaxID=86049 RepID=A0A1C1CPU3_9EURO|nr:putative origin recognition complex subunit 2 [Cladophialophora carrionii]
MAKRKQPETDIESDPEHSATDTPSKRRRRTAEAAEALTNGRHRDENEAPGTNGSSEKQETPSRRIRRPTAKARALLEAENDEGSPTPKVNGRTLFATPRRTKDTVATVTPSRSVKAKADRSAKRKSARLIAEAQTEVDEDVDEDEDGLQERDRRLAREILDEDEHTDEEDIEEAELDRNVERHISDAEDTATATTPTPTPRKRGRPRTAIKTQSTKPVRSPTPEGDIPPEERYFYQTRPGAPQVSSNRFNSVKLLTQEEYFDQIASWKDPHAPEKAFLSNLHARAFPQWKAELDEGYSLCLYGYGSKRSLVTRFAEWVYKRCNSDSDSASTSASASASATAPQIIILNGYVLKLNIRNILNTIASASTAGADHGHEDEHDGPKLTGQPEEMLDGLLAHLTSNPPPQGALYVMVNSIDGPSLRRAGMQSLLARLAAHPGVRFVCTADSPLFPTMWNSTHLEHFRFVYHDCTTFAPYEAETETGAGAGAGAGTGAVDQVHDLLGKKRSRAGGKEGVGFVLKSLPENARNLYRLLLTEILTLMEEGLDNWDGTVADDADEDGDEYQGRDDDSADDDPAPRTRKRKTKKKTKTETKTKKTKAKVSEPSAAEEVGVEYRALYRKAAEEFICSSAMNFQFLLKEFLDHQMITSRRDGVSGAEMLGVPLGREEMLAVLEELV